jgi:hypothetical protein
MIYGEQLRKQVGVRLRFSRGCYCEFTLNTMATKISRPGWDSGL